MSIISNKTNGLVVFHFVATNNTIVIVGNNSVSNIALPNENVVSAHITKVIWGVDTASGAWKVLRGANTALTLTQSGVQDFSALGIKVTPGNTATLSCNLVGSTNGHIIIELRKNLANAVVVS